MNPESRRIQLRMLRRAVYLHALNYGRSGTPEDRDAIIDAVVSLDKLRAAPAPKRETRLYYYRGEIERGTGRGYRLIAGYSAGTGGHIEYPWLTRRECQLQAKSEGYKAVFMASKGL